MPPVSGYRLSSKVDLFILMAVYSKSQVETMRRAVTVQVE